MVHIPPWDICLLPVDIPDYFTPTLLLSSTAEFERTHHTKLAILNFITSKQTIIHVLYVVYCMYSRLQ